MEEMFLLKSIGEDGSVLQSERIQGVEITPFEDDPINGKGKIEFDALAGFEYPDGHVHWAWERVSVER